MQKILTKYWLTVHVGALLFFPWLCLPQQEVYGLVPLVWLSVIALEVALLLPTVRTGETLADARQRVVRTVIADPFFYTGAVILLFALVQWLNSDCKRVYLPDANLWQFSAPTLSWAPFSVNTKAALAPFCVFLACVAGCLCLRHAMSQTGKRYLLQVAAGVSGALAFFAVWKASCGGEPYSGYAVNGSGAVGTFFGLWLTMGMGAFVDALARGQRGSAGLFLLGVFGNLVGMLFFATVLPLFLFSTVAALIFFYWFAYLRKQVSKTVQLKLFLMSFVAIVSVTVALIFVFPKNPVVEKLKAVQDLTAYWQGLSETKELRTSTAMKIWLDHPWVGVGPDGFRQFLGSTISEKEWRLLKTDQACVYNDSVQFLCEYGMLGFSLLVLAVIMLLAPICYRARGVWMQKSLESKASDAFLLRISPLVFVGVLATGLCFLESWFSSPFRSPSVLISWIFVLAMVSGFLPANIRKSGYLTHSPPLSGEVR